MAASMTPDTTSSVTRICIPIISIGSTMFVEEHAGGGGRGDNDCVVLVAMVAHSPNL